jgi:hypothetical protein
VADLLVEHRIQAVEEGLEVRRGMEQQQHLEEQEMPGLVWGTAVGLVFEGTRVVQVVVEQVMVPA